MSRRIKIKEQIQFVKRLRQLLKAGISLRDSVYILKEQINSRNLQFFYNNLLQDISTGKHLYESLGSSNNAVNSFSYALIKVGEESGSLEKSLESISEELTKRQILKQKIISSLTYPIFIGITTILLSLFLISFIFPKITPLFSSLRIKLPITTRTLIFISTFLHKYSIVFIVLIFIYTTSLYGVYKKNIFFQKALQNFLLSIWGLGNVIRNYFAGSISRYLYLLLQGNIPIDKALLTTLEIIPVHEHKAALLDIHNKVKSGSKLSECIAEHKFLFPVLMSNMAAIGEATGSLPETFFHISQIYDEEIEETIKKFSTILEPALMMIMGSVVGLIALSIITPLYSITGHLNH